LFFFSWKQLAKNWELKKVTGVFINT